MKGKIFKIKNMEDELVLPVTTTEAVYMEDGETKLSDEMKDVLRYEAFDDESIKVKMPNVVEEIDEIKKDIGEINSSLDNKASKNEVFSMANMGQDIKEAMTGGSVAVTGVNSVLSENIVDGQILPRNTSFFDVGYNILEYGIDKTYVGQYLNTSNGELYSASACTSKFIKVKPNTQYYFYLKNDNGNLTNGFDRLSYYDDERKFISSEPNATSKIITPSNCSFIRFGVLNPIGVDCENRYLGEQDSKDVLYIGGYSKLKDNIIGKQTISLPYNRFNKNTIIDGYRNSKTLKYGVYYSDTDGLNETDGYFVSDYIPVFEGETLYVGRFTDKFNFLPTDQSYISYYDEKRRLMHRFKTDTSIVIPKTVAYIRVYNQNVYKHSLMVTNVMPEFYVPYNEPINVNKILYPWLDKYLITYGDSITAIGNGTVIYNNEFNIFSQAPQTETWQQYIVENLKFSRCDGRGIGGQTFKWNTNEWWANADGSYNNRPESGGSQPSGTTNHKGAFCSWDRIKTMLNPKADVIFIMGGTNDFCQSVPIGDTAFHSDILLDTEWQSDTNYREFVGDFNINTFKGSVASTIMKIQAYCPNSILVLGTPLSGDSNSPNGNLTNRRVNSLGLSTMDYANAIKDVAQEFSIPCIDVNGTTGINVLNRTKFLADNVHPYLSDGKKALARAVISGLKNILPNII